MKNNSKVQPYTTKKRDVLDEFIDKKCADEMGLLDLVLIEEMLDQTKQEKPG